MPTSQVRVRHVLVLTADRRTDLVGRPLLYVHPTISMTYGGQHNIQNPHQQHPFHRRRSHDDDGHKKLLCGHSIGTL
jgi:hypothetical protein